MKRYIVTQAISITVAVILVFTFYILLLANMLTGQNLLTPLILIINTIVLLAIFTVVSRMEHYLKPKKK